MSERSRKLQSNLKNQQFTIYKEDKTMLFSSLYIAAMAIIGTKITEEVNDRM